ncbi:glucose-6-phosphate isomerase [Parasphingopyxis marina]|uniref:Glucose-6-phosphate isomerase n=1 Tax=Parasphingopyxis marina TaxID=2761622 RepID=A0A842I058_9SPHN|nr:glucose-6-phosphate isomerase [Parasphingopyxis marina]MBC2777144.1 glucose-6-phosphate isomerase [Parasphingopyxis marina]
MTDPWTAIETAKQPRLTELFEADPDRLSKFSLEEGGLYFDFAKTHLDDGLLEAFEKLAEAQDLAGKREALFAGEAVNISEGRAAEHMAQRGQGAPDSVALATSFQARMRALIEAIGAGALGDIRHILHLGIGGSALGPDFVIDALARESEEGLYNVAIVSNVDGAALEGPLSFFEPEHTLLAIASKSFTTSETMLNAESTLQWMREADVADPFGQMVALTAAPDRAIAFGIDETRVLPFPETVGGRYSLWSSIGFPIAAALGWGAFERLLEGAAAMDRHFRLADWRQNAPVLAAFADLYYTQARGAETRAVFAYDERLRLLPDYLQQLEMESNGKAVTADGKPLGRPSAPITWGGVGTDAQHAVFQLLHQGTHLVPAEFIAVAEAGDKLDDAHHEQLLVNCFAQGAALMAGRDNDDPARAFPGDRPSTTILMEQLDPASLGALIAFYEHRTFVNAALLGINPFDQFGVELGKDIARAIAADDEEALALDPSTLALIERAL